VLCRELCEAGSTPNITLSSRFMQEWSGNLGVDIEVKVPEHSEREDDMKGKLFAMSVASVLSLATLTSPTLAKTQDPNQPILTKEQQTEVAKAKAKTDQIRKQWETQAPTYFQDPKSKTPNSSNGISSNSITPNASSVLSRAGVFLVELDSSSSSSLAWAGGHAGMVWNASYTVESFGNKGSQNGVRYWPNNWTTRYTHFQARTCYDTTFDQDYNAAAMATTEVGKPYNYNFFYINQDSSFYCSQLVWYCFHKLYGIDLNDGGAVWPVDLVETDKAFTIYSQ
jgi:uncharacterized protein YycO